VAFERAPSLPIPDMNPAGLSDAIAVGESSIVRGVEVFLDISHTYRGDLRVRVIAPDGREAVVHDRAGGSRPITQSPYRFSDATSGVRGPAPHRGEHNVEILNDWLGRTPADAEKLEHSGVLLHAREEIE